jgi:hypothetical protein
MAVLFGWHLSLGPPERGPVKKSRIVIQRYSRLFLPLMVNVECRCRINFKRDQAGGRGIGNAMMSDFTPRLFYSTISELRATLELKQISRCRSRSLA